MGSPPPCCQGAHGQGESCVSGVAMAVKSGVRRWGLTVAHVIQGETATRLGRKPNTCFSSAGEVATTSPVDEGAPVGVHMHQGTLPLPPRGPVQRE